MIEKIAALKKYNFWNNDEIHSGFTREIYTHKIENFLNNNLIKVLVGQRRTGKSYILRQIIQRLVDAGVPRKNILYINKEFTGFDFIETYQDLEDLIKLYLAQLKPEGKVYFFFDEIQNIQSWEKLVNSYSQDYTIDCEIFITGSNSELLSGELSSLLSGRYIQFEIFPFSYTEYISHLKLPNNKASFLQYLNTGGLPELFNLRTDETKRHYVSALKDTVLLRDIIQKYRIKDAKLLDDIFTFLVNNASNLISITNIINYFKSKNRKTNYETISNYINYLKTSYLIHQTEKYNISGKEILAGTYKFYINDLAFKNYLYPGFSYGMGYQLENLVYLQLKNAGYDVYAGYLRNKEVDFVALKNAKKLYVQVSYLMSEPETIKREYASLASIKDNFPKIIVSLDELTFAEKEGIKHLQIWNLNEYLG